MMQTDWYLLATPMFSTILILTVLTLKLSLKSQIELTTESIKKLKSKQSQAFPNDSPTDQQHPSRQVLQFLFKNYSFLQSCCTNKSKNKLHILLSFSIISVLCFFNPHIIVNSFVGLLCTFVFIAAQVFINSQVSVSVMDGQVEDFSVIRQQVKQEENTTISKFKWLYIAYSGLGSVLALVMVALVFKNYSNSKLLQLLKNIGVSCVVDLLVNKSVAFLLVCYPFSVSSRVLAMIENEKLKDLYKVMIEEEQNALQNCATNLSPRKKQSNSPTKIPKAVSRLGPEIMQYETMRGALQMAKKIKKEKSAHAELLKNLTRNNDVNNTLIEQFSINQLFDETDKNEGHVPNTPIAMFGDEEDNTVGQRTKRKETDLVIVEFKRNQEQPEQSKQQENMQRRAGSFLHSNLDFEDDIHRKQDGQIGHQRRLNIVKLLNSCNNEDEEGQRTRKIENCATLNIQRNYDLKVSSSNHAEEADMEEIDGNSPQRRRKHPGYDDENSEYKLKKKAKHYTTNTKRRVIKFTSGEPYLQYLPNMLTKDHNRHKKSQPINCKHEFESMLEERGKSIKRAKAKKEPKFGVVRDENQYPGTLEVEDI